MNKIKIMGIVNINSDSFHAASRVTSDTVRARICEMIDAGADMIDVGALSSRPGSEGISDEAELERLRPTLDLIKAERLYERAVFSLDSYSPLCLDYAFGCGFEIANDITALANDDVARVCARHKAQVCLMHMKGSPKDMQQNPRYDDVVREVDEFFAERIDRAKSFGVDKLILDVGIGFGKSAEHNITLIKHHAEFLHFGYPLLIGASRKSIINTISPAPTDKRLGGTIAIHLAAAKNGATIIRAHDVPEHVQAVRVWEALQ
jgi:dihydropteroate synthase